MRKDKKIHIFFDAINFLAWLGLAITYIAGKYAPPDWLNKATFVLIALIFFNTLLHDTKDNGNR